MPKPQQTPQPKRPSRVWLFGPYVAVAVALLAWSGVWMAERSKVLKALNEQAQHLRAGGYQVAWSGLTIDGWPFRLHLTLQQPHVSDASGWAFDAPTLEAVGLAYTPSNWVLVAPSGLTLTRPDKGPLAVSGKAIRASIGGLGSSEPRFSFEGDGMTFAAAPGGLPAPLAAADKLELHLQPGPDDQAALLLRLEGATLRPTVPLAVLAGGKPLSLVWDSRLSHMSAFQGATWPAMLQSWTAAGGLMQVAHGQIGLSGVTLAGDGGPLMVGPDGRLRGQLPLQLDPGQDGAKPLLQGLGLLGPVTLRFQDGRASIGPIPVGQALKVG